MPKRSSLRTLLSLYRGGKEVYYYGLDLKTWNFFTGCVAKDPNEDVAVELEEAVQDCDFGNDSIFEYYNEKLLALRI